MATATVLQLSDTHLTDSPSGRVHGLDPRACLQRALDAWEATGLRADLVILTGDNTDDGSLEACQALARTVGTLGAPVFAVSGNHDLAETVTAVFGSSQATEVGAWQVVGLASQRPGQTHGTLDLPDAVARLDRLDERPTVVAIHHPPLGTSTHPWFQLDGAEQFLAALAERPQVRAVISGHLHEAFDRSGAQGLALLGGPSTLYALHHDGDSWQDDRGAPTGGRVLFLADDGSFTSQLLVTATPAARGA